MAEDTEKLETLSYKPGCPLKEPLKEGQQPICSNCETPNQNLMIIEEIEGLMSQVNEKIRELPFNSTNSPKISQTLEEIDLIQKTTLFELRKAFE